MTATTTDRLYRVRPRKQGLDLIRAGELAGMLFAEKTVARPPVPALPNGEWYCEHDACVVREVRVACKYLDGPPPASPPRMKCPACGQALTFQHYVDYQALVPVSDN